MSIQKKIVFSFPTEFQMVMDATIIVTFADETTPAETRTEVLYPARHKITLPINFLNNYFQNCEIAYNHHTRLDCDRNYFLDFDGWGLMSALDQNFNPSKQDIQNRTEQGNNFLKISKKVKTTKKFFLQVTFDC